MITKETKQILIDSINAAHNTRTYVHPDRLNEPGCVIGQLAFRLGVSVGAMKTWGNQLWFQLSQYPTTEADKVWEFEKNLPHNALYIIQGLWDSRSRPVSEDAAMKSKLIEMVEGW